VVVKGTERPPLMWVMYHARMMGRRGRFLLTMSLVTVLVSAGCSHSKRSVGRRIDELAAQQSKLTSEVGTLQRQRDGLRNEIRAAEARAERARCVAQGWSYRAAIAKQDAVYTRAVADYAACAAKHAESKAELGAVGCIAGIIITGGLGAAVCGGALLAGGSTRKQCGIPPERPPPHVIEANALREAGLSRVPACVVQPRPP